MSTQGERAVDAHAQSVAADDASEGASTRTAEPGRAGHAYRDIVDDLSERYAGTFTRAEVAAAVEDSRQRLEPTATVTAYLPIFVRRFARDRLLAIAETEGRTAKEVLHVLFVCRGNAGRSQMAAAFAEGLSEGRMRASSAGTDPSDGRVLESVRSVMAEKGYDLHEAFPKPVTDDAAHAADVIVTMGVDEGHLPAHGKHTIVWDVPPVAGEPVAVVRGVRDDLEARVRALLRSLLDRR